MDEFDEDDVVSAPTKAEMDSERVATISADLKAVLMDFCEKHSVEYRVFGGRHDDLSLTMSVEFNAVKVDEFGRRLDKYAIAFQSFAPNYGIDPAKLFKEIDLDGLRWKIVGLDKGSKKTPIMLKQVGGEEKRASYSHSVIVDQLARQEVTEKVAMKKAGYVPPSREVDMESEGW